MSKKLQVLIALITVMSALAVTLSGCVGGSPQGADDEKSAILYASIQREEDSPDWVTALPAAQNADTAQLFVVAGMGMDKTTASVSMHERDKNGQWKQILSTPGYVGKNGLCLDADHAEGWRSNSNRRLPFQPRFRHRGQSRLRDALYAGYGR